MAALRFVLMLLLSMAPDVTTPLVPEPVDIEESTEEAVHRPRSRHAVRPGRDAANHGAVRPLGTAVVRVPGAAGAPASRHVAIAPVRKVPPPAAESPSAPEDH